MEKVTKILSIVFKCVGIILVAISLIAMFPLMIVAYLIAYSFLCLYSIFSRLMKKMGWGDIVVKLDKYL